MGARSKRRADASLPRSRMTGRNPSWMQRSAAKIPAGPQPTITTPSASPHRREKEGTSTLPGGRDSSIPTRRRNRYWTGTFRASIDFLRSSRLATRTGGILNLRATLRRQASWSSPLSTPRVMSTSCDSAITHSPIGTFSPRSSTFTKVTRVVNMGSPSPTLPRHTVTS